MTEVGPSGMKNKSAPGVRLPTPAGAKQWEELEPGTFDRLMTEIEREEKHRRRMEWADLCQRIFGQVCALGTVVTLAFLARYFVDHGAATQGAAIIVTGAVSIVTVFVTGRLAHRR
jgi:uncharacterized membrane protein